MKQVRLHFYAELNDFLAPAERNNTIQFCFNRKASIKDVIESCNVPHTEIDLIIVNDVSVNFNYNVLQGDNIHVHPVYPAAGSSNPAALLHLTPAIADNPEFIVDVNLGRLARYLRLLGLDCLYSNHFDDATIAEISSTSRRIILTRDRKLLQRKIIRYGYFVRAEAPKSQVKEVLIKFNLHSALKPLTRCTFCNEKLVHTDKRFITHRLKPLTKKYYDKFLTCPDCGQIYWQGSHNARIKQIIKEFSGNQIQTTHKLLSAMPEKDR
ncbi:Mut7-C RNAse domain-containing protein [Nitrosomonas sp.]|uniref:Mut7-C RNAse domain-containing protein n=1 Tax=Nitrosomonas sp. TaxID=42353 RepID=UPI00284D8E51|nr:Mut7-C RNAse domain-containing protein [Nitrosomonas sp.]MDR4514093.1 Mut7-C ubiquitin/RNAse domain-containing protein [Nitrosomonas sp.]